MTNLVKSDNADLAKYNLDPEMLAKIEMAREALESFEDAKMPAISFKDGQFVMGEGADPVSSVRGVIIFTHKSNIYFEKQWRPGQPVEPPKCFSPDGKFPGVPEPQHKECRTCPKNQFKSSTTGDGKACRNVRPVYILLPGAMMPRLLRVPPTSLKAIEQYALNAVADCGSYWNIETIVEAYKKDSAQSHWNMRFSRGERLPQEEIGKIMALRCVWLPVMKTTPITQEDLHDYDDPANAPGVVVEPSDAEVKF